MIIVCGIDDASGKCGGKWWAEQGMLMRVRGSLVPDLLGGPPLLSWSYITGQASFVQRMTHPAAMSLQPTSPSTTGSTMVPIIYESDYPEPYLPAQSVFHYLLPDAPAVSPLPAFDPSLPVYIDGITGRTVSRGELENTALRLASGLRGLGMNRGDVVNIWAPNSLEFAVAVWGAVAAGLVVSPSNIAYERHELAHQVNDSGASFFFVAPSQLSAFEGAREHFNHRVPDERVVLVCEVGPGAREGAPDKYKSLHELLGERAPAERFETDPTATAFMFYSSGTTGLPKGVMTSHYNLTTQLQTNGVVYEKLYTHDRILGFLPMSHMYGAIMYLMYPLKNGCAAVIMPKFEELAVYKAIQEVSRSSSAAARHFSRVDEIAMLTNSTGSL